MKLLVIDDQRTVAEIVARIARQSGWEVILAADLAQPQGTLRAEKPDVLLLDYATEGDPQSPRNGLATLAELRSEGFTLPTILFTGWPNSVDRKLAAELGVMRILEKPLSLQDLRQSLVEAKKRCLSGSPA